MPLILLNIDMYLKKIVSGFAFIAVTLISGGQDTWYGSLSGMYVMYNPSYSGCAGSPSIRLSCISFFPGSGYSLNSVFASCDGFIEPLHGGISAWASNDMPGKVLNDLRTGFGYSYHLKAADNLYFNAGLSASLIYLGINRGEVTFPGDYDPFRGFVSSSETIADAGMTLFDIGTGISFSAGPWYGGFSAMHLTQPYLSKDQQNYNRLKRLYSVNAGCSFPAGSGGIVISPSITGLLQGDNISLYLGTVAAVKNIYFGIAGWYIRSGFSALEPSFGWNAEPVKFTFTYSYAISAGNGALPASAVVKASINICSNNVHKRKVIHIIKLPEL